MILYYIILAVYKFALDEDGRDYFEDIINYSRGYSSFFPISFVLGFFVSTIMTRWYEERGFETHLKVNFSSGGANTLAFQGL